MSLQISTKTDKQYHPVFLKILEDIPGGITLLTDRIPLATTEIKKGALLHSIISTLGSTLASTGIYRLVKTAKISDYKKSAVTLSVLTNHEFKVGEFIGIEGAFTGVTIVTITKGVTTDQMLFLAGGKGLGSLDAVITGNILEQKTSATVQTELYAADVILRATLQVRETDLTTLQNIFGAAVVRGTVNESLLPYFVTATDKTALTSRVRWA